MRLPKVAILKPFRVLGTHFFLKQEMPSICQAARSGVRSLDLDFGMNSKAKTKTILPKQKRAPHRSEIARSAPARAQQPDASMFTCLIDEQRAFLVEESLDERERRG